MTAPDAILWDLDGTLIDSEPYWIAAEHRLAAEHDVLWTPEDDASLIGVDLWDGARHMISRGIDMDADDIVARLSGEAMDALRERLPFRPGAIELLTATVEAGIPMALVTMSTQNIIEVVVDALTERLGASPFLTTVGGDQVEHGKPHPDAYLLAAERLGVDPRRSIGIEDSFPGTAAALAAGLITIGVPHAADVSAVPGIVHWPTLEGRTVADLEALVDARVAAVRA